MSEKNEIDYNNLDIEERIKTDQEHPDYDSSVYDMKIQKI